MSKKEKSDSEGEDPTETSQCSPSQEGVSPPLRHLGDKGGVKAVWETLLSQFDVTPEQAAHTYSSKNAKDATEEVIRHLYCHVGWDAIKISNASGIGLPRIRSIIQKRKLVEVKQRYDRALMKNALREQEADVEQICFLTVAALKQSLIKVVKTNPDLSMKEIKLLSDSLGSNHRVLQLIKNKPTSISETREANSDEAAIGTLTEAIKQMCQDPMFDIKKFIEEAGIPESVLRNSGIDPNSIN